MKVALITDSGANLSKEFIAKHKNLYVIPLMIIINGTSYRDQIEVTAEEVYRQIDEKQMTTSLPNMDDLKDVFDNIQAKGIKDVLVINISSGLSGTYNAFRLAFETYQQSFNITHYDSKTLGGAQGYLVEEALELLEKNVAIPEIIKALDQQRYHDSLAIYTINTLKYLKRGGRIGKVEGTIGDILKIKPVITVNDEGVYVTLSKGFGLTRSLLKMKDLMVEKFADHAIDLTVHYGDDLEKAESLSQTLNKALNVRNIVLSPLTPVLGIHTGPMMFSFIARKVK
jgi:DegV family protein with EDD domain